MTRIAGPCDHNARVAVENTEVAKANARATPAAHPGDLSCDRAMRKRSPVVRATSTLATVFSTSWGASWGRISASRLRPRTASFSSRPAITGAMTTAVPQGNV